jgi:hypothetical protein
MAPPAGWPHTQFLAGRLVATYDRGTVNYVGYDGRARLVEHAKRVAKPSATEGFADRYAPRWYRQAAIYDAADREIVASTGAECATPGTDCSQELLGLGNHGLCQWW